MHIYAYKSNEHTLNYKELRRKLRMGNNELSKAICRLIVAIATKEKNKSVSAGDYGTAIAATIVEGIFNQVLSGLN